MLVPEGFQQIPGLSVCPKEWKVVQANEICSKITKGTTPPKSDIVEDGDIPFLRVNNLTFEGKLKGENELLFVSESAHRGFLARSIAYPNDILMNIVGPPLGKIVRLPADFTEYNLNQAIIIYRLKSTRIDIAYFLNYLKSNYAQYWLSSRSKKTSGQQNLTIELCKELPVPLPSFPEQQKIAQILSTWDKAIEKLEALIAAKQKRKKALMQQLLTGKKRFAGFEGEWTPVRLSDLQKGKKCKGKIVPTNSELKGLPYIGSTSFEGSFGLYSDSDEAVICNPKDILILWDGENAGKVATNLTGVVSSTVVRCRLKSDNADNEFITYCLLKDNYKIRAIREGSGIPHMPGDFEYWYELKIPHIEEQQKIASVLTTADTEIQTHQKQLTALKQQKKGLMQQLLTGKKRVNIGEAA